MQEKNSKRQKACIKTIKWQADNRERYLANKKKFRESLEGKFGKYKYNAKRRGLTCDMDIKLFNEIIQQDCHYCGSRKSNGVDRIDSKKGYSFENILPCCRTCNIMKMAHSYSSFLKHIETIYNKLIK